MNLKKIYSFLLLIFLFLLPWQTRVFWHYGELNSGYWEYGTFSIYATEILLWAILLLFFIQHFVKKEFWIRLKEKKSRAPLVLILFLLSLGISVVLSKNFWVSYNYVFHVLEAMALMTVLARENEKTKYQTALWSGAVLQSALAIYQFLTQQVWASKWLGMAGQEAQNLGPSVVEFADQRWLRAYGSFGSPNSLGIYLAVLFVLGLVLYLKSDSAKKKIITSAGQLIILSGLLLSYSRAAWLAALAGILCLFVILSKSCHSEKSEESLSDQTNYDRQRSYTALRMTIKKDFIKQIIFAGAVIIFWVVIFYPVFTARFNTANRLEAKSISERKGQYAEAVSFVKINPIFGIGPGAYTYALFKKYPTLAAWQYQPIHDVYLLVLVEIGLAGVVFLFFLFKRLFGLIVKKNLIYVPVVIVLIFSGIFDHWLVSMYSGIIFLWTIVGLGMVDKNS